MAPFDKECYYKPIIREMIMHENHLINHRLTWLCQIQGFLFSAFALSLTAVANNIDEEQLLLIRYVFCSVGILVALTSLCALRNARKAINKLLEKDEDKRKLVGLSGDVSLPVIGLSERHSIALPWICLPIIIILAWALIALIVNEYLFQGFVQVIKYLTFIMKKIYIYVFSYAFREFVEILRILTHMVNSTINHFSLLPWYCLFVLYCLLFFLFPKVWHI